MEGGMQKESLNILLDPLQNSVYNLNVDNDIYFPQLYLTL